MRALGTLFTWASVLHDLYTYLADSAGLPTWAIMIVVSLAAIAIGVVLALLGIGISELVSHIRPRTQQPRRSAEAPVGAQRDDQGNQPKAPPAQQPTKAVPDKRQSAPKSKDD